MVGRAIGALLGGLTAWSLVVSPGKQYLLYFTGSEDGRKQCKITNKSLMVNITLCHNPDSLK